MKTPRWKAPWQESGERPAIYHCTTRVAGRRPMLGAEDKSMLLTMFRNYEEFCGCRLLAYCVLSDHCHLLVEVPPRSALEVGDQELLRRLALILPPSQRDEYAAELRAARSKEQRKEVRERQCRRMHDLSAFMTAPLRRYSRWFNLHHQRKGGLWEARFKSTIIEAGVGTRALAAYIDLNPVRAGLVKDPADYRWSSYGEAMVGNQRAQAGLVRAWHGTASEHARWETTRHEYQLLLIGGETFQDPGSKRFDVPVAQLVRRRVRHFSDGVAVGSREFIEEVFQGCRAKFSPKRKTGARHVRTAGGTPCRELWCARELVVDL